MVYRVRVKVRVRVRVRGCLSAFSARGYNFFLGTRGLQIGAPIDP